MSDEPGRGEFEDWSEGGRPSVWSKISGQFREKFLHRMGRVARLENAIESGWLVPFPLAPPADTFWIRSVVCWEDWMESYSSTFNSRPYTLDYRKPGYDRRLEEYQLGIPEVEHLIQKEVISDFSCDITAIRGMDEFPILRCPDWAEPVTDEHLQKKMRHGKLRLARMRFAEYP
ncbi:UNVERIFIED_ORG: hypothetical protein J2Y78_004947 [Buttiauxella agrestis ATCC 33320]